MIEKLEDEKIITSLFKTAFDTHYIKNPFEKIYVYKEKEILGFISYSVIYDRVELNYIYVDEKVRRKHIASSLLEVMLKEEVNSFSLEVNQNNKIAILLYNKYGFKIASKRNKYYHGEDAFLMVRE